MCNLSIKLGIFPNSCEIVKLKGPKINFLNYTVISLLSLIIKNLIHEQTSSVLSNNEIVYNYQSGL